MVTWHMECLNMIVALDPEPARRQSVAYLGPSRVGNLLMSMYYATPMVKVVASLTWRPIGKSRASDKKSAECGTVLDISGLSGDKPSVLNTFYFLD